MNFRLEIEPSIWLTVGRNDLIWKRLQLLAFNGEVSHETLTALRRHQAITRETDFQIAVFAWTKLRPVLEHLAEEINK